MQCPSRTMTASRWAKDGSRRVRPNCRISPLAFLKYRYNSALAWSNNDEVTGTGPWSSISASYLSMSKMTTVAGFAVVTRTGLVAVGSVVLRSCSSSIEADTPVNSRSASAIRCSYSSPPWPPRCGARSGCAAFHRASTSARSIERSVAPSLGGSSPDRPIMPSGPEKNRTRRRAFCRAAVCSPCSRARRNCSTVRANASGDVPTDDCANAPTPGLSTTDRSSTRCSAPTTPAASSALASGIAATTAARSRRRRASRWEMPVARVSLVTASRSSGSATTSNARAAWTSRSIRSSD